MCFHHAIACRAVCHELSTGIRIVQSPTAEKFEYLTDDQAFLWETTGEMRYDSVLNISIISTYTVIHHSLHKREPGGGGVMGRRLFSKKHARMKRTEYSALKQQVKRQQREVSGRDQKSTTIVRVNPFMKEEHHQWLHPQNGRDPSHGGRTFPRLTSVGLGRLCLDTCRNPSTTTPFNRGGAFT